MNNRPLLYVRTARHLKPSQIVHRVSKMLARKRPTQSVPMPRELPPPDKAAFDRLRTFLQQVARLQPAAPRHLGELRGGTFRFLNLEAQWPAAPDWNAQQYPRLWRYQLHYLDALRDLAIANARTPAAADAALARSWLHSWLQHNPPGKDIAWDPYVISCRLMNWACALAAFPPPDAAEWRAFVVQTCYLHKRPERDVLGNHLLKNALALSAAGALGLSHVLPPALELLREQLEEQILADGGHYERSAMYHAQLLFDCLLLHAVLEAPPAWLKAKIRSMSDLLVAVCQPDGEIPLFGDAAFRQAFMPSTLRALSNLALQLPPDSSAAQSPALQASGFYILGEASASNSMIVKAGEPGPPYQLAHAHSDALSYELSVGGLRMVVDSGVHGYGESPWREYCRSTRAHNTVCVDDEEQLECWSTFRVARRYRWLGACWSSGASCLRFAGSYRLPSGALHHRTITYGNGEWTILDRVSKRGAFSVKSCIHLHPEVQLEQAGAEWHAHRAGRQLLITPTPNLDAQVEKGVESPGPQGWYCPEFGLAQAAPVLIFAAAGAVELEFGYTLRTAPPASQGAEA